MAARAADGTNLGEGIPFWAPESRRDLDKWIGNRLKSAPYKDWLENLGMFVLDERAWERKNDLLSQAFERPSCGGRARLLLQGQKQRKKFQEMDVS